MAKQPLFLSLLVPALSALLGCGSSPDRYMWSPPVNMSKAALIAQAKELLPGKRLMKEDVEKGTLEYDWEEVLAYFRLEGTRKKIFIKVENREKGKDVNAIGIMIRREVNDNIDDPIDPDKADWDDGGFDTDEENYILFRIVRRIAPDKGSASAEWLERQKLRSEYLRKVDEYADEKELPPAPAPAPGGTEPRKP
ncbi:MAG: hypothetical protein HZA54_10495 [Planctomycetes bacterium]|nr:hypothetical protein [Planctomycetota bacterium]